MYITVLAGVTLMALGAMAKYPGLDVKIVPVGKNDAFTPSSRSIGSFES